MRLPPLPAPGRVLIVKPSSLGDVVGTMPVLRGLRRTFPRAHLAWLVAPAFAELLRCEGDLNEVVIFDRDRYGRVGRSLGATLDFLRFCRQLRKARFDWVIDLQGLLRSGILAAVTRAPVRVGFADCREAQARRFYTHSVPGGRRHAVDRNIAVALAMGVDARPEDFRLTVSPEGRRFAESLLARSGLTRKRFVALAPGTTWPNKFYPSRHWKQVVAELSRQAPVVLTGAGNDLERSLCAELAAAGDGRTIDLAGQTTLPQLVATLAAAGAVVCSDTAANFIAPAVGTPSVALLGPTPAYYIGPYGGLGRALHADLPCLPCRRRSCRHVTCMQLIRPEQVVQAVRQVLDGAQG